MSTPASNYFANPVSTRPMRSKDIVQARALSQAQNWPHTESDWAMHLALGEGWVATLRNGNIIGTLICWAWGSETGTLGLIIVDQHYQGRGIGRRLMSAAMSYFGERKLQLVSTKAGMGLYLRSGFQPAGQILQLQGQPSELQQPLVEPRLKLRPITAEDLHTLISLDKTATGMDRTRLLRHLSLEASGYLLERDHHTVAFAMQRRSGKGTTIGPVIARNQSEVKLLLCKLLTGNAGFYRIDVPRDAGALVRWLQAGGLREVDSGTLMQNSPISLAPAATLHRYALASQALG